MKTRFFLFVCFVVLVVFMVWWLRPKTKFVTPPRATAKEQTAAPAKDADATTALIGEKRVSQEQLLEIVSKANRPISFFGKVIDQDGNPVPAVRVTFEIRYMKKVGTTGVADTFDYPAIVSGTDGLFSLTGAEGSVMRIKSMEKAGYEPSDKSFKRSFSYWRDQHPYEPDSQRPEIFRMWKKAGAEKLVKQQIMTRIPYDGTPTVFDLISGTAGNEGDLRVSLVRNPRQIVYGQRNYEWTLTVEAIGGGVIETLDEQMYRAPKDSYQPRLVIHMPADAPNWSDSKSVAFYIKSRGENYGSVQLEVQVGSDKPTTGLTLRAFVNPSGSRNLEYNPLQNVTGNP